MSRKSRVPDDMKDDDAMRQFLDATDRRQVAMGQIDDLSGGATLADVIAKVNAILATQRTR